MAPTETDADVIRASLDRPSAFGALFDRHFDRVYRFVRRRVDASVADELAADTFVRAFELRTRYRLDRPDAWPWLVGIAANLLRHHHRHEQRRLRAYARTGVDPVAEASSDSDARLDAAPVARRVAGALAELRREERDVLLLHAWADLEYEDIAEALDIPLGTVRSRLSRARARVRELLAALPPDPPTGEPLAREAVDG